MPPPQPGHEHRRHGRLRVNSLVCQLGRVEDLSCSGMRVAATACDLSVGQCVEARLEGIPDPFPVRTNIVWIKKTGRARWEIGLVFIDLTPEVNRRLLEVVRATIAEGRTDLGAA